MASLRSIISKNIFLLIISIAAGIIATITIYGVKVLNPMFVDWLMHQGDLTQHYVGWLAFRNDSWHFPLGLIKNIVYPEGTSLVFMDSIPLAAIFFKLFNGWLPEKFQYFGFFCVFVYSGQAFFAAKLIKRLSSNPLVIGLGTTFFMLSPVLMQRMFFHTALSSHFLILAGMLLFFEKQDRKKDFIYWTVLNCLTVTIHIYLTSIVFILFTGYCAYIVIKKRNIKYVLTLIIINMCMIFLIAIICGYFVGTSGTSQEGFGIFSMNLNALVNSMTYSAFLRSFQTATEGQHESFMYLGLGGIFGILYTALSIIQSPQLFTKHDVLLKRIIIIISFLTTMYAISNVITFNEKIIFTIPLHNILLFCFNIFRASARFFWIPYYFLLYLIIYVIVNSFDKDYKTIIALALLVCLQVCDLGMVIKEKRTEFQSSYKFENKLTSNIWDDIAKNLKHIIIGGDNNFLIENYAYLIEKLIPAGMTINNSYLARDISSNTEKYTIEKLDALKQGIIDEDTAIIIKTFNPIIYNSPNYDIFLVNGLYIVAPVNILNGSYTDCEKISSGSLSNAPRIIGGTASKENDSFHLSYDGKSGTRWSGNSPQQEGDEIIIELNSYSNIDGITLECPNDSEGYAHHLSLYYSLNGHNWNQCKIRYLTQNINYIFDSVYCKFLKIRIDKNSDKIWTITEIAIKGSSLLNNEEVK